MSPSTQSLFQTLFEQYHSMVLQLCKGFAQGDRSIADDFTQETFINVWKSIGRFEGRSSYKTWIYRIAVNTCLQHHRKNKSPKSIGVEALSERSLTEDSNEQEDKSSSLYEAISQLEKVDRVIIMMVLEELEYKEISEVLGISEATLRVKVHRIKKRLKKIITHGG